MATKKCPKCGKKIAMQASYCIYCAARFDDPETMDFQPNVTTNDSSVTPAPKTKDVKPSKKKTGVLVAVIVVAIVAAAALSAVLWVPPLLEAPPTPTEPTQSTTTTTRDPRRDAWLQSFAGRWVDEGSVGKKDIAEQGGALLFVHEIRRDLVGFDLISYSGGEVSHIASVSNVIAILSENTLHFTFDNDTQGHSGEGYLRFRDHEVDLQVLIDGEESLPEGEHSLAMNTVFKRIDLPQSDGTDLRSLTTLEKIKQVAGEPTAEPVTDEKTKKTTYIFGALSAIVLEDGTLESLSVDYRAAENKALYRYDCVDGTMDYLTIKKYFGEALHDYVEQPTAIRVLYYEFKSKESVRFVFDAEGDVLIKIHFVETLPTTSSQSTTQQTTATQPSNV